jgi:hypothetical protein
LWLALKEMLTPAGLKVLDARLRQMPQYNGAYSSFRTFSDASKMKGFSSNNFIVLMQLLGPAIGFAGGVIEDRETRDKVHKALRAINVVLHSLYRKEGWNEVNIYFIRIYFVSKWHYTIGRIQVV